MNKRITAEQVAKVMDIGESIVEVRERTERSLLGHSYSLTFSDDVDFSMHEIIALAALFGAKGVTGQFSASSTYHSAGFSVEVTES